MIGSLAKDVALNAKDAKAVYAWDIETIIPCHGVRLDSCFSLHKSRLMYACGVVGYHRDWWQGSVVQRLAEVYRLPGLSNNFVPL